MTYQEKILSTVFLSAAIYNVVWGVLIIFYPNLIFKVFDIEPLNYPFLMSGIGMFVAVYGYGYWVVSRDLYCYPQLVVIGLLGKTLGPIGWGFTVLNGDIPGRTLWVNVFNDLIWLPFFVYYLFWYQKYKQRNDFSIDTA